MCRKRCHAVRLKHDIYTYTRVTKDSLYNICACNCRIESSTDITIYTHCSQYTTSSLYIHTAASTLLPDTSLHILYTVQPVHYYLTAYTNCSLHYYLTAYTQCSQYTTTSLHIHTAASTLLPHCIYTLQPVHYYLTAYIQCSQNTNTSLYC